MSGYKDILKKGWHPEKEGSTLKGQMKSLVGRGDNNGNRANHVSRPLSSLQDPASFGPPPVRSRNASPGIPSPPISRPSSTTNSSPLASPTHPPNASATGEPPAPPKPYRADTSGLSTSHLPPPPPRREMQPPPPLPSSSKTIPPGLPPRLPPRNPAPPPALTSPVQTKPPTSSGLLNQGAINRLGAAGISVPGFGIGTGATSQPAGGNTPPPPPTRSMPSSAQIGELSSRFSRLGASATSTSTSTSAPGTGAALPPAEGTTFEQKKAALRTAAALRENPSSVSLADARAAASTANNFRQRHGNQVAAGLREANKLNDKYGGRLGNNAAGDGVARQAQGVLSTTNLLAKKKQPPPPPRKPQNLSATSQDDTPPIPLATRPHF